MHNQTIAILNIYLVFDFLRQNCIKQSLNDHHLGAKEKLIREDFPISLKISEQCFIVNTSNSNLFFHLIAMLFQ